jgi:hypothetical protein
MVWWYDARVTKLHEEETGILKKVIITSNDSRKNGKKAGEKLWLEDGWIVQGRDMDTWYKKGFVIKPENVKIEHSKQSTNGERKGESTSRCRAIREVLSEREWQKEVAKKRKDVEKYKIWKGENKNVEKIKSQEDIPNSIKAFAIKMETRAGMTRNQWHGENVERECPHCNKLEDEAHAFKNCKWTKEVTKMFKDTEKNWNENIKIKNRLSQPLIGARTSAWPMRNRQSQTLAWMIWKIRKIKEHEGEEVEERKDWGEVARSIYGRIYREQKYMEDLQEEAK